MVRDVIGLLREHGIQPSAQRVAVARYVLVTEAHPSADQVFAKVKRELPTISRATVYNTLHAFVEAGLLREVILTPGRVAFDPNLTPHHHFVDEKTGTIVDVPWSAFEVHQRHDIEGLEISEYQVVLKGRRVKKPGSGGAH
jgi:Fe2+ or Zn2+ uptake regulation protein